VVLRDFFIPNTFFFNLQFHFVTDFAVPTVKTSVYSFRSVWLFIEELIQNLQKCSRLLFVLKMICGETDLHQTQPR